MVYEFTQDEISRLEACRVQFNRLGGTRWSLEKFISWTIKQTIEDSETASLAVMLALPDSGNYAAKYLAKNVH